MGNGARDDDGAGGAPPLSEWSPADAEVLRGLFLEEADEHLRRVADAHRVLTHAAAAGAPVEGDVLDALLRTLHTLKGAAGSVGFDTIGRATHDLEELVAEIRTGQLAPTPGILDRVEESLAAMRALLDGARVAPARRDTPVPGADEPGKLAVPDERAASKDRRIADRRGGERVLRLDPEHLEGLLDSVGDLVILRTRIDRRLRELEALRRDLDQARGGFREALATLGSPGQAASGPANASEGGFQSALDRMAEHDLEIATALRHLERATQGLVAESESLRRTTVHLETEVRRARLVPLETMYLRLAAALRELERAAGRKIELVMSGANVELDRSIVDQIQDPMLHLLRNAVAHGLEGADERVAAGKPALGRIEITARVEGELVHITFADDGRGVDVEKVRETLERMGRLKPGAPLSERAAGAALFEPGFSTLGRADALAGRGMGLNVVRTAVTKLGGDVAVDFSAGKGTRFRLSFPLTTAIMEAFLLKAGGQVYAVPAANIVEALPTFDAEPPDRGASLGARGDAPVLRLHVLLGADMPPDHRVSLLRLRAGDRTFVMTCDRLIGTRTIVVRPLGPVLGLLPYLAGVTISGAGKAQLVLDVPALAEAAHAGPRAVGVPRRSRLRVLVVDDSRLARETAARILGGAGFHAVTAEDGWEAWELLGERRFDALITDLEMPRVDGFELIARVRRDATLKGLPIVVMSSRTSKAVRDRALEAGANKVLPKVPNRRVLGEALSALLGRPPDAGDRSGE